MLKKRKAPSGAARGGGRITTAANLVSTPNYSLESPHLQAPFNRHFSALLDQAISRQERCLKMARFYYNQASQHRQIRASLEQAIFGEEQ